MELIGNNRGTTLAAPLSAGGTSLTATDAGGWPEPTGSDFFRATLIEVDGDGNEVDHEIILVSSRSGNGLSDLTRGQEDTADREWPAGTRLQMRPTAGMIANLSAAVAGKADASHTHAASAIVSGTIAPARLGTGTANDTKVLYGDGTWKDEPGGGGGGDPTTPVAGASGLYEADGITGLSLDDPVGTWPDASGDGKDLAGSGSDRPLWKDEDDGDGLPFVRFDGSGDHLINAAIAYTGSPLTLYMLVRQRRTTGGNASLMALGGATFNDSSRDDRVLVQMNSSGVPYANRNGQIVGAGAAAFETFSQPWSSYVWQLLTVRYAVIWGRAVAHFWNNGIYATRDLGGATLNAFDLNQITLGGHWWGGLQASTAFDLRALAWYKAQHPDAVVRRMRRYLAAKWEVGP